MITFPKLNNPWVGGSSKIFKDKTTDVALKVCLGIESNVEMLGLKQEHHFRHFF